MLNLPRWKLSSRDQGEKDLKEKKYSLSVPAGGTYYVCMYYLLENVYESKVQVLCKN